MAINRSLLRISKLQKTYPGAEEPAVIDVSFDIRSGEIMALLGPNGAGKTTTVKMAAGLVLPTSGEIRIMGADVVRQRQQAVRHIGAVLEGARNLYWRLSARENLLYFGRLRGVSRRELEQRIDGLLEVLDLAEHQHKEVRHFSRGMQQKLAIAAALLHDPEVLLLDEPTLGLDVQAARKLEQTIAQLAHEQGKSVLLTTHTMPLAEKLAERIFVIHHGREIAFDRTEELLGKYNGYRDTTEIRVVGEMPDVLFTETKAMFPEVTRAADSGVTVLIWRGAGQPDVMRLLNYLDSQDVAVQGFGRRQATLEEVFLSLTESAQG